MIIIWNPSTPNSFISGHISLHWGLTTVKTQGVSSHLLFSSGMLILWQNRSFLVHSLHKDWFILPFHFYGSDSRIPLIPPDPNPNPSKNITVIQVSKVHYCNTVPLQMQNALNTIKLQKISVHTAQKGKKEKKKYQTFPSSTMRSSLSLPTSVQIFTFLIPIKM